MPTTLTSDPIMSIHEAKEWGNINDDPTAKLLINIVSEKFRSYTQRIQINESALTEVVFPLDGNAAIVSARPIEVTNVVVTEKDRSGETEVFNESDDDVIVDRERGRIYKTSGLWNINMGFPSLSVEYTGGWAVVPFDIVAGALAQMKIEQQRLKGLVGADTFGGGGDSVVPETAGLLKSVVDAWKPYRVMMP